MFDEYMHFKAPFWMFRFVCEDFYVFFVVVVVVVGSIPRYRKVVLNNCTKGVKEMYTARKQQCPNRPPKGLLLTTKDGKLTANLGSNVTFLVHLDEVRT